MPATGLPVTALYAALLAPLLIVLSVRVIVFRRAERVSLGDGGHAVLLRRVRAHANFIEYAPFALILLGVLESLHAAPLLLHAAGASLLAGRIAHAMALSNPRGIMVLRVAGMMLTFAAITIAAAGCLAMLALRWA